MVMSMKMAVFSGVAPCSVDDIDYVLEELIASIIRAETVTL
jgi:hypothetical protein